MDKELIRKILSWYILVAAIVSIIEMIFAVLIVKTILSTQFSALFFFVQLILPLLGIASGIFLLKKKNIGWYLSLCWSILQIPIIITQNFSYQAKQLLEIPMTFLSFDQGGGLNLMGIILLIFLIYIGRPEK